MVAVDRISNVPTSILDLILERLPIDEAARTTTLSKTWRNVWVKHPNLIFDEEFISRLVSKIKEGDPNYEIVTTISNILFRHPGPILKFHLFIPRDLLLDKISYINTWILKTAYRSIRMLEIVNNQVIAYKMPSDLFFYAELTHLHLSNCELNAPHGFLGFLNLISVELSRVLITADMSFGSQLQTLVLRGCTGIKHLEYQFNWISNLKKLIIDSEGINWQWTEGNGWVIRREAVNTSKNSIYLDKLLRNIPRIHFLRLDGYFLKLLEPDRAILYRSVTTMDNLDTLHLVRVGFHDLVQVEYVLYLIRSSPNLLHFSITLEPTVMADGMESSTASRVQQYLQLPNLVDMILDKLESADIVGMVGARYEFHFIKFLLASSPSLKWMKISKSVTIDDIIEELRILEEVVELPRASTTANIIWN